MHFSGPFGLGDSEKCLLTLPNNLCWQRLMTQPVAAPANSDSDFLLSFTCLPWVAAVFPVLPVASGDRSPSLSFAKHSHVQALGWQGGRRREITVKF